MPLFHIHGLIAATLSSLAAGASVWCTPGFNALRFFTWTDEIQPSYVPKAPLHEAKTSMSVFFAFFFVVVVVIVVVFGCT